MALSLSKVLLSEGNNDNLEGKSSEEEDHLNRCTKKIKESTIGDDDTMLDNPTPVVQAEPLDEELVSEVNKSIKPPIRSFKDALVDRRLNERPFDWMMNLKVREMRSRGKMLTMRLNPLVFHASHYLRSFWQKSGGYERTAL
ncbi:hypothetical protein CsSME_00005294 [Camellia sinensis var. sinensis]